MAILSATVGYPQGDVIWDRAGQVALAYASEQGFSLSQRNYLKTLDTEAGPITVPVQEGEYAFYTPDGNYYALKFRADENGFVPIAEHIPTPPPAAIVVPDA